MPAPELAGVKRVRPDPVGDRRWAADRTVSRVETVAVVVGGSVGHRVEIGAAQTDTRVVETAMGSRVEIGGAVGASRAVRCLKANPASTSTPPLADKIPKNSDKKPKNRRKKRKPTRNEEIIAEAAADSARAGSDNPVGIAGLAAVDSVDNRAEVGNVVNPVGNGGLAVETVDEVVVATRTPSTTQVAAANRT
jgi:hypothetical protein